MKLILDSGATVKVKDLTLKQWREFMAEFMSKNPHSQEAWDIMGCVRGPDFPSERPDMSSTEQAKAYQGRRHRKYETVEVLREAMFYGVCGGSARRHRGDHVVVASDLHADHFDRHVSAAAHALGIEVRKRDTHE